MDQQLGIQPSTLGIVLLLFLVVGVGFALIQLRRASARKGAWVHLGYRPFAGGKRLGLGHQAAHHVRTYQGFEVHYLTWHKAGFGKTEVDGHNRIAHILTRAAAATYGADMV